MIALPENATPRHRFGRLRTALARCEAGVVAVEFALLSSLFFLALCIAMDFGQLYLERSKMNEAIAGAAVSAFSTAATADYASMQGYVRALANNQALNVTTACNGTVGSCTNQNRTCSCLRTDGTFAAHACGTSCTGGSVTAGSTAGYYLTVSATQTFQPLIVPNSLLGDTQIVQHATVRLQ